MSSPRTYRWSDLPTDHPMPRIDRQRIMGQQAMLARVHLHKGFTMGTHAHANEQFAVVLSGKVRFGVGAEGTSARREFDVSAGEVLHLPANVPHSAEALEDSIVLDIFAPPSETTGVDRTRA